jgi:aspartate 1-decarboxylase
MLISVLKCKIHRATVTDAQLHYQGSITIDRELMEHANLKPFEKVMVVCLDSGERLETYVIEGEYGSGDIILNGAAARKILKGDTVIIMAFAAMDEKEYGDYRPIIVTVDGHNKIIGEDYELKKDDDC